MIQSLSDSRILVVGAGSIGRRHLRNLHALGFRRLTACDPDSNRLEPMVSELGVIGFDGMEKALRATNPEIVFVCTPPVLHVDQAIRAVEAGAHVFIEKPLGNELAGIDRLIATAKSNRRVVQVGYNLRFHPGLKKIKEIVDRGEIGKILWARAEAGQYLPDWRPWQDYRDSYTARRELGGGIILDGSHEIDYIVWLMGRPVTVICMADKVSDLEVDVEDCATILIRFANGSTADVHLDFVQRTYDRSCRLVGDKGTLVWEYTLNRLLFYKSGTSECQTIPYCFETGEMYIDEVRHFVECIERDVRPGVGLEQAKLVLEVALAARSAALRGQAESIACSN